jgi:taurine dioxygenase
MKITPGTGHLGARVDAVDLAQPLDESTVAAIRTSLGRYGVLCFPGQHLDALQLKHFSARFGTLEVNVANNHQEPGIPEVMVLSNIVRDGKPVGFADAGQSWHTDLSYSKIVAFTNVLHAIHVPVRGGQPLGNTEFSNMHAAYAGLPEALKRKLSGMTVTHDHAKFWNMMRRERASARPALTAEQLATKPPVSHPLFLVHPLTGLPVLYANPGYAVRINELPEAESTAMLDVLFEHQTRAEYRHAHQWRAGDVLMWDNLGTIHRAIGDYRVDEPRLIKRCQVRADQVFARPSDVGATVAA